MHREGNQNQVEPISNHLGNLETRKHGKGALQWSPKGTTIKQTEPVTGPNNLWAPLVTLILQLIYCLLLCCAVGLLACI